MSNDYTFLQDKRFLQQLDALKIKEQFIKITVLNWKEEPLKQIQGVATSGSVNLDGNSSMRRTATLSLFAEEKENNLANIDHLFSINKKCKLELGIVNTVPNYTFGIKDQETDFTTFQTINYKQLYGDIIWFPLGIYVMFNPSITHNMQGVSISMQLKDKMCLLNGDLGGQIHSSITFSSQDQLVDINAQSIQKNPVLIYNIIKELVNHWGNEQLHKIIISEVPLQIKYPVKWIGKQSVWYVENQKNLIYTTWAEAIQEANGNMSLIHQFQSGYDIGFIYTDFVYPGQLVCNAGQTVTSVLDKIIGVIGNYEYFYDVEGNFVFRQKQNYLNMTNTAYWTKQQDQDKKIGNLPTDVYEADTYRLSKPVYNFIHNEYTTAYNNTLNYNNIKNDFVVWGSYPTTSDNYRIPCRFHLAIDKKPQINHFHNNIMFYEDDEQVVRGIALKEEKLFNKQIQFYSTNEQTFFIIEKQASTFEQGISFWNQFIEWLYNLSFEQRNDFEERIKYCLIKIKDKYYTSNFYYINKIKNQDQFIQINILKQNQGTEQIIAFKFLPWYYNGNTSQTVVEDGIVTLLTPGIINTTYFPETVVEIRPAYSTDWRQQIYYQMLESEKLGTDQNTEINNTYFQYYAQLKEEFPKIFDLRIWTDKIPEFEAEIATLEASLTKKDITEKEKKVIQQKIAEKEIEKEKFINSHSGIQAVGYKTDMEKHPNEIGYYLDFIDEDSQLGQYSVSNIGRRAKIIDDNNEGINCVFEPQIPDLVYLNKQDYTSEEEMREVQARLSEMGQKWTQVPDQLYSLFKQGGTLNSCFEKIKDLLYQYTHVNNTISITTLPIYYLEPNTRITVEDAPAGIYGDYIIQSISLPLDISSTMNINAYKALQKI